MSDRIPADERDARIKQLVSDFLSQTIGDFALSESDFLKRHAEFMPELGERLRIAIDAVQDASSKCRVCGAELSDNSDGAICGSCSSSPGVEATMGYDEPVAEEPDIGRVFGGYRIARQLGKGGMGSVYEAFEVESGRRVALKVLNHKLQSTDQRKRFLREGPMPVAKAVDAILDVIAGLEAVQSAGVLHRDIKPANCFVASDGTVKVGDFGLSISSSVRTEANLTQSGVFLGTPAYASPEQLRGAELDVRSDIYSVGVTLYFLLTGEMPFNAENMVQLLENVLGKPAPSSKTQPP